MSYCHAAAVLPWVTWPYDSPRHTKRRLHLEQEAPLDALDRRQLAQLDPPLEGLVRARRRERLGRRLRLLHLGEREAGRLDERLGGGVAPFEPVSRDRGEAADRGDDPIGPIEGPEPGGERGFFVLAAVDELFERLDSARAARAALWACPACIFAIATVPPWSAARRKDPMSWRKDPMS